MTAPALDSLRTERLLVRPLRRDDWPEWQRVHELSEDFFRPWVPRRSGTLQALFEMEMAKAEAGRARGLHLRLVGELADGRLAGFFNLGEIVRGVFQNAYASWMVSADCARRGYGTEGVRALLDLAFSPDALALHRVQANVIPENRPSVALAERVGLRREGLALRYLEIDGRWRDHLMFARTVEEHVFTYV